MGTHVVPSETDITIARTGIKWQAETCGLDLSDPKIIMFIEHQVKVVSAHMAMQRMLQNVIHEPLTSGDS